MKSSMRVLATLLLVAAPATACPYCETEIGEAVSAGIFNDEFGVNVLLTLLPIPVLLGIVALIHFGPPVSTRANRHNKEGKNRHGSRH